MRYSLPALSERGRCLVRWTVMSFVTGPDLFSKPHPPSSLSVLFDQSHKSQKYTSIFNSSTAASTGATSS